MSAAKVVAVVNQKGGVGKSTTAAAIAAGISLRGLRALAIDLDPQGNLSHSMGADRATLSAMDALTGAAPAADTIIQTARGGLIPSSQALTGADARITETGKEYRLKEALEPIRESYDVIVIDTPPSLGILVTNALTAATGAIIPAQADTYSLQGIGLLYQTVQAIRKYCNSDLRIDGILLTRHNPRSVISRDMASMMEDTAAQMNTRVFKAAIRECVAVKEAQAVRQDIFTYAPKSNASADYAALISEYLENWRGTTPTQAKGGQA